MQAGPGQLSGLVTGLGSMSLRRTGTSGSDTESRLDHRFQQQQHQHHQPLPAAGVQQFQLLHGAAAGSNVTSSGSSDHSLSTVASSRAAGMHGVQGQQLVGRQQQQPQNSSGELLFVST
jgi:hypothetical protein